MTDTLCIVPFILGILLINLSSVKKHINQGAYSMKQFSCKALVILGLLLTNFSMAAEIQVYFQKTVPPVSVFTPPEKSDLDLANKAFLAKYQAEAGLLGTAEGTNGALVILVSDMSYASTLWRKMVAAGDAYQGAQGSFFRFGEPNSSDPLSQYKFAARINIPESASTKFSFSYFTPVITKFMLVMDNQCVFSRASVQTLNNVPVQPTQLMASYKISPTAIGYEHLVNGGSGANLTSILITMGAKPFPGPGFMVCPVNLFIQY